jgi:hypothetical protein
LVWHVLLGQRMQRNSTLDDIPRVKYMHGYLGGVLDALRYAYLMQIGYKYSFYLRYRS